MDLNKLIEIVSGENPPEICLDSRDVGQGDCFIAIFGTQTDGHSYIAKAIENGAAYVVSQKKSDSEKAEMIVVKNTSIAAATLAQARYSYPARKLTNLAVTGTNGKTTVTYIVRHVLNTLGHKCGMIGTVQYDTGSGILNAPLTTPDCVTIAKAQQKMIASGCTHMVIEASSHALHQNRLAAINFTAAAFTNLTGDHLDYHITESAYLDAKAILFKDLAPDAVAVLNAQSEHSKLIAEKTKANILWYGIDCDADLTAHIESMTVNATEFKISYKGRTCKIAAPLIGQYNISNYLTAAGLCIAAGLSLDQIAAGLSSFKSVPGRLERVDFMGDFTVFVDYAHTDDALKNVLTTLKPLCKGRLIVLFGCGGDRDHSKRPRMAAVAEKYADYTIVTSDNPRTEKPGSIIEDIIAGFKNANEQTIFIEPDRAKAIKHAVNFAGKNDIVLIAGKGHENYQILGTKKIHFSDNETALECLFRLQ